MVLIVIFAVNAKIYCTRSEKYRSKLRISRSFVTIFAQDAKILVLAVKYSSKLDFIRSLIRIFATNNNKVTYTYVVYRHCFHHLCGGYIH